MVIIHYTESPQSGDGNDDGHSSDGDDDGDNSDGDDDDDGDAMTMMVMMVIRQAQSLKNTVNNDCLN